MKYLFLFFLVTLFSCATDSEFQEKESHTIQLPVETSKVSIDKGNNDFGHTYGPQSYDPQSYGRQSYGRQTDVVDRVGVQNKAFTNRREPICILHLAPAAYHAAGYISFFKSIEQRSLKISAISAEGFSIIPAALYAKYMDSNRVEWKMYALLGKLKGTRPFEKEWKKRVSEFLHDEFSELRVQQLRSLLLIPLLVNNEIVVSKDDLIHPSIMSALNITSSSSKGEKVSSLLSNQIDYDAFLRQVISADLIFQVSITPEVVDLENPDGYLLGIYSKKIYQLAKHSELFYQLDYIKTPLDQIPNIGQVVAKTKDSSDSIAKLILKKIEKWKTNIH